MGSELQSTTLDQLDPADPADSSGSGAVSQSGVSSQRGIKIGHFGDLGPSWGLDGGPESQNDQNDIQDDPRDTQMLTVPADSPC